mmetsp:Transcript_12860/g.19522  ORF Transcript_12860/g.19522 Transcript_12860/m.19522 type:complete len:210 (-) Transcript_12860:233-862(-)
MKEQGPVSKLNDNDVLCGRGGGTNNQRGNIRFRDLVAAHMVQYRNASRKEKPVITQTIVKIVRDRGGRFLKRKGEELWFDIGDKAAVCKTGQTFRDVIASTRMPPTPEEYNAHLDTAAAAHQNRHGHYQDQYGSTISVDEELMKRRIEDAIDRNNKLVASQNKKQKVQVNVAETDGGNSGVVVGFIDDDGNEIGNAEDGEKVVREEVAV